MDLNALLMGAVEGFTEFLPISSTGHLILLGALIGFEGPPGKSFEIAIQLGAILAVSWVFRWTLLRLLAGMWRPGRERYYVINLVLAFLPAALIGATLYGPITQRLYDPYVVCAALIVGGIAIIAIERIRREPAIHEPAAIGPLAALLIGCGQALAMIPGTSRSGATIIAALLVGCDRRTAAEFSFVLAIPTMGAAAVYSLYKARDALDFAAAGQIGTGFAAAFVVAFLTVRWLLAVIGRIGFTPFGWYRIVLGLFMLGFLLQGRGAAW